MILKGRELAVLAISRKLPLARRRAYRAYIGERCTLTLRVSPFVVAACSAVVTCFALRSYAQADLDRDRKALEIIATFAEQLCGTVGTSGKATEWSGSADAKADVSQLVKKVADLGFEAAAKYASSTYEGVLQKDLTGVLATQKDCKLRVFSELKDKLLPASDNGKPTQPQHVNRGTEHTKSTGDPVIDSVKSNLAALRTKPYTESELANALAPWT